MASHRADDHPIAPLAMPVDPWADLAETKILPEGRGVPVISGRRAARPRVFGRVYELLIPGLPPDAHLYIGKTEQTLSDRLAGHRSAAEVRRFPWKANLPRHVKDAMRVLETVYESGEGRAHDVRELARAEAFWIDRLNPSENGTAPAGRRPDAPRPARVIVTRPKQRLPWGRLLLFATLAATATWLVANVIVRMELPWPWAPWAVSPAVGLLCAWAALWRLHHAARQLVGAAPAPRRRATGRRRR